MAQTTTDMIGGTGKAQRARNVRMRRTSAILDAAELEFAKGGFDGTALQSIADRAGLQKRQVLYFFQNKENLYRAVIDRIFTEWRSQELKDWTGNPRQIICDYIDNVFAIMEEKPHRNKLIINEMMRGGQFGIPVMKDRNALSTIEKTIERLQTWMDRGDMLPTNPLQFIFMLWSFQHFLVAFEPEVAYFLRKKQLKSGDWLSIKEQVKSLAMVFFPNEKTENENAGE